MTFPTSLRLLSHCILTHSTTNTLNPSQNMDTIAYVYLSSSQCCCECAERAFGRKRSLSKVRLRRYVFRCMRVSFLLDIELRTPVQGGIKVLPARRYYVQFSVGDTLRLTNTAKETKNRTSWDESLFLLVNVFCFTPAN